MQEPELEITPTEARKALETMFSRVHPLSKDSKAVLVKADNCTVYIPVINLDESVVLEFRKQFATVYKIAKG